MTNFFLLQILNLGPLYRYVGNKVIIKDFVAYPSNKSKALLLQNICYYTVSIYSYIHAIHKGGIGHSHNSLLNTLYAQLYINVYVTRYCTLAY